MDKIRDGSALNLSTGEYTSFIDFVANTAEILGFKPNVIGSSNTPEGVFARGGDTSLQEQFGFTVKRFQNWN